MTQTDGEIYHVTVLEEPILSKWLYYPKDCRFDAMLIKLPMAFFHRIQTKTFYNQYGNTKESF